MQSRIRPLERRAGEKQCRKRSKAVKKSRKKRTARAVSRSGADPKCRALHFFGKNEAKWELQKENVRKWKRARAEKEMENQGK